MADSTVAALTAATTLDGTELYYGVQSGADAKVTGNQIRTLAQKFVGSGSGTISVLPQAAAGTYNLNLPITAGNSGDILTSGGGGSTAMTWTTPTPLNNLVGAQTGASIYGTTGYALAERAATDTDTASSGTIATTYVNSWGARTLAASSATTLTTVAGSFFDTPLAGTNVTITNPITAIYNTPSLSGGAIGIYCSANTTSYRGWVLAANTTGIKLQRWSDNLGTALAAAWSVDNAKGNDSFNVINALTVGGVLYQHGTTVASLPTASSNTGGMAYITDGDSGLAWGATAVNSGSGATKYLVWSNGTAWTVAGK